jgi:glycine/D-amino acid oxidase-like deaminating enzyme
MSRIDLPIRLWMASAGTPVPTYDSLSEQVDADVAIVGGGFTGLSAALHLAEAGCRVCLVEAEEIGHGASGRNGGQVNPGLKLSELEVVARLGNAGRGLFRLGEEATDFLAELVKRKGLKCSFIRPGLVRLAHNTPAMNTLQSALRSLNERGVAARWLDRKAVETLVGTRRYVAGILDPRGGSVHPLDLVHELARVAAGAGARIFARSSAKVLSRTAGRWHVDCPNGRVVADNVIVATNGYTDGLVPGLARSLLPVNSFQVATDPIDDLSSGQILPGGHAVYDSRRLVLYFRKSPDGRVMLGGRASFVSNRSIPDAASDYSIIEQTLIAIFPQLQQTPFAFRWTGLVCITPDHLPHYHQSSPGLHALLGYNGRGVALSIRAGAWLAHKLLGVSDTGDIPATPIRPIPLHSFRQPIANLVMQWHRVMDVLGR